MVGLEVRDAQPAHWAVDFWTADVAAAIERVERFGGMVLVPPFDEGIFRRAVIVDQADAKLSINELVLAH